MQSVLIIHCFICKVSLLLYLLLYMQSVLIIVFTALYPVYLLLLYIQSVLLLYSLLVMQTTDETSGAGRGGLIVAKVRRPLISLVCI